MRLTLRTLLAYLDGILEPNDAEDIAKKIEESEYAAELVNRIRDVMRRLRLGAPSLSDRGPGLDPNTVAEYLDNTLTSERVTDFEKVCLDSDIHLAEVASSHQILTLVLGEPAEVDPAGRQRMYLLKEAAGKVKPPPTPAQSTPAMPGAKSPPRLDLEPKVPAEPDRKPRPKPTVPEYLREPRKKSFWPAAVAAVLLAACFTFVVLMAFGQFEPGTVIGNYLVQWGLVSAPPEVAAVDKGAETKNQQPAADDSSSRQTTDTTPTNPPVEQAQSPAGIERPEPLIPAPSTPPVQPAPEQPPESAGKTPDATPPGDTTPPAVPGSTPKTPETKLPDKPPAPEPDKPPMIVERPPLPPEPLGRLMSSEQVLLGDGAGAGWSRVAANQMLTPQNVLVPPTYRPKIALTMGVTLEILGGSRVELLGGGARELPGLRVLFGRIVLMPLGKVGSRMRLCFGDRNGTLAFADAETVVALEVRRVRAPGSDPENGPSRIVADLYATTGGIAWEESADGAAPQPIRLAARQRLSFDAQMTSAPAGVKELPPWIESSTVGATDRRASASIADALPSDRLARVSLMEIAVSRPQKEVKWLALRCLGYLGQFDDMVLALDDSANKLVWLDYVEELRAAVGRDAESAAAVRLTLEKQFPQQAAAMYRMLWGYGDKDLQAGEDAALVRALDDDLLAVRVLSYWNLRDITGQGAAFQPEQTAARRQQSVRRWRQRLDAKEIRYPAETKETEKKAEPAAPINK